MDPVARNQLYDSRKRLAALQAASAGIGGRCGYGIIASLSESAVADTTWHSVNSQIDDWSLGHDVPFEKRTIWIEPSSTHRQCIRWWGSRQTATAFSQWATNATFDARLFVPHAEESQGHHGTLRMLFNVASTTSELSDLVGIHPLPARSASAFEFLDVVEDGITFALAVIDHFLSKTHQLVTKVDSQIALLDGVPYPMSRNALLVLEVLLKHEGYYVLEDEMIKAYPELEGMKFARVFKDAPAKIKKLIEDSNPPESRGRGHRILLGDDPLIQPMS